MGKIPVLLATLGLVVAGTLVPVTSAQAASEQCDKAWHGARNGYVYAYDRVNCSGLLGTDAGNDVDWGDDVGGFQTSDTNSAESLLHKGTSGLAVRVFDKAGWSGHSACLRKSEYYVSDLRDDLLLSPGGKAPAANTISSHRWVTEADCGGYFLR